VSLLKANCLVANGSVSAEALLKHPHKRWAVAVYIVVYLNLRFSGMESVQPPSILHQSALPGDRHGQERGVEPSIIEALTDIASGSQQDSLLVIGNGSQLLCYCTTLPSSRATAEYATLGTDLTSLGACPTN